MAHRLLSVTVATKQRLLTECCKDCDCDLAGTWSYSYFSVPDEGECVITKKYKGCYRFEFTTGPLDGNTGVIKCDSATLFQRYANNEEYDGTITDCDRLDWETGDFWTRL
jgi:hypothetical protein